MRSRLWMREAAQQPSQSQAATCARDGDVWLRVAQEYPPLSPSPLSIRARGWRSRALCQRSSGDLARHFRTRRSSAGEAIDGMVETGGGLVDITAAMRLAVLEPTKLLRPVIIS